MDTKTIREQIATEQGIDVKCVKCYHCAMWGYNCGEVMNSMGESRCQFGGKSNQKTCSFNWCKHFQKEGK